MIKLALNCAAKLIDLWPADWILIPSLGLECRTNCHDTLTKLAGAINSAVRATSRNLKLLVTQKLEKRGTELFKLLRFECLQFCNNATLYL